MKKTRNFVAMMLVCVMMAALLSGCGMSLEDIAGTWERTVDDTEEQALILLENVDFYEEEIACVDLTSLDYIHTVEFTADGTYTFGCDIEGTKLCVAEFYRGAFDALYENRTTLNDVYGETFDAMTMEEFMLFYAGLYNCATADELINLFVENAYDYTALAEPFETGTCRVSGDKIYCIITGDSIEESITFGLKDDVLTLTYANGVQVFYRA